MNGLVFLLLALLLLLLLPEPWSAVAGLVALALFGLEVFYFYRRMRGVKVATGVENLVGTVGTTVEPLDPEGHVRVQGELWQARASEAVPAGTKVRVVALDELTLEVETVETLPVLQPK
ncbi:MAG TPA: NfeD family protein [Gaiellaceae bacterium]|nr:NfeD family protein [Gaiellaceae bacterium]